jgi:hypothetical protein
LTTSLAPSKPRSTEGSSSAALSLTVAITAGSGTGEAVVTTTVAENTLSGTPEARRVVERVQADASGAIERTAGDPSTCHGVNDPTTAAVMSCRP